MSGLFHRDSTDEESPQTARPAATMQFGPLSMRIMSRPLGQLQALASNCVPCGRVQSHMRSINIMHGPNRQRVETVTEVYYSLQSPAVPATDRFRDWQDGPQKGARSCSQFCTARLGSSYLMPCRPQHACRFKWMCGIIQCSSYAARVLRQLVVHECTVG